MDILIQYFLKKNTIYRTLFNSIITKRLHSLRGRVLDIGAGDATYEKIIKNNDVSYFKTDYMSSDSIDFVVDFNKTFPIKDNDFDSVLLFNSIYIAESPQFVIDECYRILKRGGEDVYYI